MDFLDPSKKKAHKIRLYTGYFLMSIVITLGTVLIFNFTYGYDIDRDTGNLVSRGIMYVDSKPKGAKVFINDEEQRNVTDTRLVLRAGVYTVRIEAGGFRSWERTVDLNGHEIERIVYPYLIPNNFVTTDVVSYDEMPALSTQSPDRRWLVTLVNQNTLEFDVFDLNSPQRLADRITIPATILSEPGLASSLKLVEWSTDNRHVLFERTYGSSNGSEYIILDRENPELSININKSLGISPTVISLKNKRSDQFYYMESTPGVLRVADTKARTISAPLLEEVIDYRTYGDDIVLFVTQKDVSAGKAEFRILEGDKLYNLRSVAASEAYPMDVSKFDNQWYYVVGGSSESRAYVYEDPLHHLKKDNGGSIGNVSIMRIDNPRFASFSAGTQFISLQSGGNILTIDLDKLEQYRFELAVALPVEQKVQWMDGHRMIFSTNNQSYIVDYDGSNEQTLVTSQLPHGPFFDRDYDNVFTFEDSKLEAGKKALTLTVIDDR